MTGDGVAFTDDDTGIEILPGVVVVDLTVANVGRMTVEELDAAMAEAEAQAEDEDRDSGEVLGDLDLNPL